MTATQAQAAKVSSGPEPWPHLIRCGASRSSPTKGRPGCVHGAVEIEPETENVEGALAKIEFGKADEAEALIHRPCRLHRPCGVQHDSRLAELPRTRDAELRQRLADALAAEGVIDGEQPDTDRVRHC